MRIITICSDDKGQQSLWSGYDTNEQISLDLCRFVEQLRQKKKRDDEKVKIILDSFGKKKIPSEEL